MIQQITDMAYGVLVVGLFAPIVTVYISGLADKWAVRFWHWLTNNNEPLDE